MYITTGGLVLRETTYKESSKILTVLTASDGKLTVSAKGARRKGSKSAAGTQLLTYSEMTLYSGRGGWTLTEARSIEQFTGIRNDLEKLSLASYFAELLEAVSDEDTPNPEILQLGLNGLFAVSESIREDKLIKAAFELRLMSIAGYTPAAEVCAVCGKRDIEEPYFSLGGTVFCRSCNIGDNMPSVKLCRGSLDALRFIISAEPRKIFSFSLPDDGLDRLAVCAESYLLMQLDRRFHTLDYYKKVKT